MIEMTAQEAIMVSAPLLQEQSEFNVFKTVPKFAFPQVTQTESRSFSNFIPNLWAINPLSVNLTKWWNTLKQFVASCQQIICVSLTILLDWHLKG